MIPLSKLHRHASVPIWYALIFFFFMSSIFFGQKILSAKGGRKLSKAFYFLTILMTLRFLLSVIQRVQSDAIVLFLLSLFIFALFFKKDVLAGASLGTAVMVKLTPLIFLPYLLLRRKFKAALACCGSIVIYLFVPALYVGAGKNLVYLKNWLLVHQKNPPDYIFWYKNQSLLSLVSRFSSKDSSVGILNLSPGAIFIIFAILAAGLCLLIFLMRKGRKFNESGHSYLIEVSLVLILMIILSPLGWKHTFVHLLIPHMALLYYCFYINPRDLPTRALLIGSFALNTMLNPELTRGLAQLVQEYSNVTFGTLILFAGLIRANFKLCKR